MKVEEPIEEIIKQLCKAEHQMVLGDTFKTLKTFSDQKFDMVITSPPYNIGKEYEAKQSIEKYLEQQEEVIDELIRVTSDNGSICWQVGNYVDKGKYFRLTFSTTQYSKNTDLSSATELSGILDTDYMLPTAFQDVTRLFCGLAKQTTIFSILMM